MATSCPPQVASTSADRRKLQPELRLTVEEMARRLLRGAGQVLCGLHGHEHLMQFDRERLYLKCISCGHESPGWQLPVSRRPVVRPEPALVARPALRLAPAPQTGGTGAKRVA